MLLNLTIPGDKFELKLFVQDEQFKPPFQVCVLLYPCNVSKVTSSCCLNRFKKVGLGVAHRRIHSPKSYSFFESDFFIKVKTYIFDYNIQQSDMLL